ncbi:hypothetical protein QN277_002041 [Acacia crassicarpa]|uniref:Pentatricopeptide repeat-containing protein n=1 Tax=Acacia crassicarpa TaxID=499986 RepID=A0AAE1NAW3_9FABA|nr:hypothetical protein QN277_002041 [Acacia crassicarpa]
MALVVKLHFEIEDLFEELLDGFRMERNLHLLRAFDALVKTYASVDMLDEVIGFVFKTRHGIIPHIFACNFLINRLVIHDKVDTAFEICKRLNWLCLSPNDFSYTIVIRGLFNCGKLEEADDVMREMDEGEVPVCSFSFSTYIEGLCKLHRLDLGYQLQAWRKRKANGPVEIFALFVDFVQE